jgi:hypothetical protein
MITDHQPDHGRVASSTRRAAYGRNYGHGESFYVIRSESPDFLAYRPQLTAWESLDVPTLEEARRLAEEWVSAGAAVAHAQPCATVQPLSGR